MIWEQKLLNFWIKFEFLNYWIFFLGYVQTDEKSLQSRHIVKYQIRHIFLETVDKKHYTKNYFVWD